jgi:hypothetical protein
LILQYIGGIRHILAGVVERFANDIAMCIMGS